MNEEIRRGIRFILDDDKEANDYAAAAFELISDLSLEVGLLLEKRWVNEIDELKERIKDLIDELRVVERQLDQKDDEIKFLEHQIAEMQK